MSTHEQARSRHEALLHWVLPTRKGRGWVPAGRLSPGPGARREPSIVLPVAPKHFWSENTGSGFTIVHLPFRVAPARACVAVAGRAWRSCLPRCGQHGLVIADSCSSHGPRGPSLARAGWRYTRLLAFVRCMLVELSLQPLGVLTDGLLGLSVQEGVAGVRPP